MVLLAVVRAESAAGAQRLAHVGEAERAGVFGVVVHQRDLLVALVDVRHGLALERRVGLRGRGLILRAQQQHRAAEGVRVGHGDRAARAVHLKARLRLRAVKHVEGRQDLRDGAV